MANSVLQNAVILLGAALVFVPIAKRLGIGSVLGYLLGGIVIGPSVLGLIGQESEDIMHATEFGVVMMLFLIGLELNPQAFWKMRKSIVGMGALQMGLTSVLLFPLFYGVFGYPLNVSIAVALSFAMSSTAIVLQTLKEKGLDKTQAGQSSFAVLLFQDIAVIPLLALLPLLAVGAASPSDGGHAGHGGPDLGILSDYPSLTILLAVLFIIVLGRFFISPFLVIIARTHMRELFTASALFIVIGVAWVMELAGISAALGAFLAGVLLANSEFRHELESDIEPFKGVLLGLFFTAVGCTIHFETILENPGRIALLVFLVIAIKAGVLLLVGRVFRLVSDQTLLFAFLLSQVGEFAFVLLASTSQLGIIDKGSLDLFMAVVTISMILSSVLLFVNEKFIAPRFGVTEAVADSPAVAISEQNETIIAGFGHFGSTLGRFLRANGVKATILDNDSDRVSLLRKMGFKVFYGDATRLDLLESAGAGKAKILISAIDSPDKNAELADVVQKHFPHLKVFMRAKNRSDAYELMDKGLENIYRESMHSSVFLGVDVLSELGHRKYTSHRKASEFIRYDTEALQRLAKERHTRESYITSVRQEIELQERLLSEDGKFFDQRADGAWERP